MIRLLFNLAAILSMVLCLGTIVFWVRSYFVSDFIVIAYSSGPSPNHFYTRSFVFQSVLGTFEMEVLREDASVDRTKIGGEDETADERVRFLRSQHPAGWNAYSHSRRVVKGQQADQFLFPHVEHGSFISEGLQNRYWALFLLAPYPVIVFMILPTIWLYLKRRESKLFRTGCCRKCGYDLRATPERCPECGMVVAVDEAKEAAGLS